MRGADTPQRAFGVSDPRDSPLEGRDAERLGHNICRHIAPS